MLITATAENLCLPSDSALVQFIVMIKFLSFICLFLILLSPAYAEEETKNNIKIPTVDFSKFKHTKSGRIDKIIDGLTILLKDGTIVRLVSIDLPDFHIWDHAPYSDTALKLLQDILPERTEVMLYQTRNRKKGRVNRMNHQLAHVVIKKDKLWVQGVYLTKGLARVYTPPNNTDMLTQMYKAEQSARKSKLGIWADESEHLIITTEQTDKRIGDFTIVEGTIQKTASVRNKIYLNFGKDWKTDFTIMITPALRKKFAHEGINVLALAQTPVRVRGWLREYNGALIELEDISHLEILTTPPPSSSSTEGKNEQ